MMSEYNNWTGQLSGALDAYLKNPDVSRNLPEEMRKSLAFIRDSLKN
jgi:hypothetical protein